MNFEEYKADFENEIKLKQIGEGISMSEALLREMSQRMVNTESLMEEIEPTFFEGVFKRFKFRVDGIIIEDSVVSLFIVDTFSKEGNLTKTDCNRLTDLVAKFAEYALMGYFEDYPNLDLSQAVAGYISELRQSRKSKALEKFHIYIFTERDAEAGLKEYKMNLQSICGFPVDRQVWDLRRMFTIESSLQGRQKISIDFRDFGIAGLPFIKADKITGNNFSSYLCIIPGTVLADIYGYYGSLLLEGNVRSFLSSKVAVNKKIRETIRNAPSRFFAYNNGIATTAMGLVFEDTPEGKRIVKVEDLQIINGGQTTASLFNTREKDGAVLSDIYVPMKLTEINSDADEITDLVRDISRSSNSQNKVSDADFFSVHPFHVEMERISNACLTPVTGESLHETYWFYERARGQYVQRQMKLTKHETEKFKKRYPKNQVITKTDLAKYRNTWESLPYSVSKGAQTNFMKFSEQICGKKGEREWSEASAAKYGKTYFKNTVAVAILFKALEKAVSGQEWYGGSYRANIVTYAIALFAEFLRKTRVSESLFLENIWLQQKAPDDVLAELLRFAEFANTFITDESRPVVNVTQWCKKEVCWNRMLEKAQKECKALVIEIRRTPTDIREPTDVSEYLSDVERVKAYPKWEKLKEFVFANMSPDRESIRLLNEYLEDSEKLEEQQAGILLRLKTAARQAGYQE